MKFLFWAILSCGVRVRAKCGVVGVGVAYAICLIFIVFRPKNRRCQVIEGRF